MAKLITKFKYIKPGNGAGSYLKYIATREGVEKIDNGIFSFNPEIKVVTDVGLFEELCDSIGMENNPKKR